MKLDSICRTCLAQKTDLRTLFDACLPNMIMSLTSVQIIQGDGLPHQICTQCLRVINKAFCFKQMVEKSDATLRNYLNNLSFNNDLNQLCDIPAQLSMSQLPSCDNPNLMSSCSMMANSNLLPMNINPMNSLENNADFNVISDFNVMNNSSSFFQDIFNDPMDNFGNNQATVVSDFAETMQSLQTIAEQYLPESWENDNQILPINTEESSSNNFNLIESIYKCQFCGESFKDSWLLDEHTKSQVCQDKYFSSNITNELTKSMLLEYTFDTNSKDNFTFENIEPDNQNLLCEICDRTFTSEKFLKKHRKDIHFIDKTSVQEEKKDICNLCGKRYKNSKILLLHMRTHTGERPLKCDICSRTFALPSSFHKHKRIHKEKSYACNVCGKKFNQQSNVNNHIATVHSGKKPHNCATCGRNFATNTNLEVHKRIHTGVKPFVCTFCDKGFISSSQLKKHMMVHTGEKPYTCWICGQSFRRKETRDTHARYHTGERPFSCKICEKAYIHKSHLRKHIKTQHVNGQEKKFEYCMICSKKFHSVTSLKAHIRLHTGQKPFTCNFCNKCYVNRKTLNFHLKHCHGQ
ncbi:unnamed protein product [Ceutorhynchus assimilis]|uniref:Uncharacterized protein n=1 Tax=Ceutorhynchus assimilis TaxID=467358 RepID=A0A9N9MWL6_9CUCU|nr:unnamed protein product [Ceutorhynchus assimilis]